MKLRFEVNQAEAFRRGFDAPNSINYLEVDPSTLDERTRHMIADRLEGISLITRGLGARTGKLILADGPTWDDLIVAILRDHANTTAPAYQHPELRK